MVKATGYLLYETILSETQFSRATLTSDTFRLTILEPPDPRQLPLKYTTTRSQLFFTLQVD